MASRTPPPEPTTDEKRNARVVLRRLIKLYPDIGTALDHRSAWELIVATVLSAQTTDEMVNKVTPVLFERWPTAADLATADPEEVEEVVYSTGFYRQKTKSVIGLAAAVDERFNGVVPADLDEMVKLPGVGRKTASVVLVEAFGQPAIAVDTHVKRVTNRLGITHSSDPVKIEAELKSLILRKDWVEVSMRFILFGRLVCDAKQPACWRCPLSDRCPYPDKTLRPAK